MLIFGKFWQFEEGQLVVREQDAAHELALHRHVDDLVLRARAAAESARMLAANIQRRCVMDDEEDRVNETLQTGRVNTLDVYIYIYTYIHTYIYTYTYIDVYKYMYAYIY